MARVGVAVVELNVSLWTVHEGIVDFFFYQHAAERYRAIGNAFGEGDHVGNDAEGVRREGGTGAAEAGNDFVENQ